MGLLALVPPGCLVPPLILRLPPPLTPLLPFATLQADGDTALTADDLKKLVGECYLPPLCWPATCWAGATHACMHAAASRHTCLMCAARAKCKLPTAAGFGGPRTMLND